MDERTTHARLHELYTRLHPDLIDGTCGWRELVVDLRLALRELLEALGAHEETPPLQKYLSAEADRLGLRTLAEVRRAAGMGVEPEGETPNPGLTVVSPRLWTERAGSSTGAPGAEGPGQPPTH